MCGIAGEIFFRSGQAVQGRVWSMVSALKHRGPDELSIASTPNGQVGCARLRIVGGDFGRQPFHSVDGAVTVVCNGEIYNSHDLAMMLGRSHSPESDCSVIPELYRQYGDKFLERIRGQFALAVVDWTEQTLILARDRFGKVPLFYKVTDESILFASEVKAILAVSDEKAQLDPVSLVETAVHYGPATDRTCFRSVQAVPPGASLSVDLRKGQYTLRSYWQLGQPAAFNRYPSGTSTAAEFRAKLRMAVERRLQGDGPVGVYVSGGIDSSSIAALLTSIRSSDVTAFSVAFPGTSVDESEYVRDLTAYLNLPLISQTCSGSSAARDLAKTVWHSEVPLTRSAPIPLFQLSASVAKHGFKVVLSGEGADELLRGYPVFEKGMSTVESRASGVQAFLSLLSAAAREEVLDRGIPCVVVRDDEARYALAGYQVTEIETKLMRYLLAAQGDRVSMAHGVEQRYPFLDEEIYDWLIDNGDQNKVGKTLLRHACAADLPSALLHRKKQGYVAPDGDLLRSPIGTILMERLTSEASVEDLGYFSYPHVLAAKTMFSGQPPMCSEFVGVDPIPLLLWVMTTHILHHQHVAPYHPFEISELAYRDMT